MTTSKMLKPNKYRNNDISARTFLIDTDDSSTDEDIELMGFSQYLYTDIFGLIKMTPQINPF